ncbi:hypothetical protein ZJ33_02205 [Salmonella enterica subsp. enterica serovar Corvallis]|nr:hypothetical protein [Salmonella enterica subsp. enterica serovar Corvallis]
MEYSEILGLESKEILFRLIRKHSDFDARGVTLDKLVIGEASESTGYKRNSKLTVHPQPGSGLVNSVDIYYNRIDLGKLGTWSGGQHHWPIEIETLDALTKVSEILPVLASTYGILLNKTEIVDADLDKSRSPIQVVITPKPGNQVWVGQLLVELTSGHNDLNNLVRNNMLAGLNYIIDRDSSKLPGAIVSYNWFVSAGVLASLTDGYTLTSGDTQSEALIAEMNTLQLGLSEEIDGLMVNDRWVLSAMPGPLNLQNARVIADPEQFKTLPFGVRTDVSKAVVLQLSVMNTLIDGYLTLYVA